MQARIQSFQSFSVDDGPGVRCVVFFQGCPLRCVYCHNPDTWDFSGGELLALEEVLHKIKRCKPYFSSEGGVTLSGGEVLYQAKFASALLKRCKEEQIHTVIETSGSLLSQDVIDLLTYTDLVYLDVKMTSNQAYETYVGTSLSKVMAFLEVLNQMKKKTIIRQVIIEGLNDDETSIKKLKALLSPYPVIDQVEFLPYHKLGSQKYEELGLVDKSASFPVTSLATIQKCLEYYKDNNDS